MSLSDFNLTPAGPPILLQQLKSGQLDAAELINPYMHIALSGGGFKVLTSVPDEFDQLTGSPNFLINGVATTETYLQQHSEILRNYIRVVNDGLQYILSHPEVTRDYWTQQKVPDAVTDRVVQSTLRQFTLPKYDNDYINVLNREMNILFQAGVIQKPVTDFFTNAYNS